MECLDDMMTLEEFYEYEEQLNTLNLGLEVEDDF